MNSVDEGVAQRVKLKTLAAWHDSPLWDSLSPERKQELEHLAEQVGRELVEKVDESDTRYRG